MTYDYKNTHGILMGTDTTLSSKTELPGSNTLIF